MRMSIICENENGWVVDHEAAVLSGYRNTVNFCRSVCEPGNISEEKRNNMHQFENNEQYPKSLIRLTKNNSNTTSVTESRIKEQQTARKVEVGSSSFCFKNELFAIEQPFMMDSQFEKIWRQLSDDSPVITNKRKRKKKNVQQQILEGNDVKATGIRLKEVLDSLVEAAQCKSYLTHQIVGCGDNNIQARCAALIRADDDQLADLCEQWKSRTSERNPLTLQISACYSGSDIVNRRIDNDMDECLVTQMMGELYLVPASCSFMLSSMNYLVLNSHLLKVNGGFDLIIIDPPWQNKSVKRKKSYYTLSEDEISTLPIPELAGPDCLVAMWVTNNSRIIQFATSLFKSWKIQKHVFWYWLKVTKSGVPVSDITSTHKQPFELLMIGKITNTEQCSDANIPADKAIVSVPCSLHSKKPPLLDLFLPYLPNNPKCFELFARNLWPGWTSWGNEVLRHQHIDFYTRIPTKR